MADRTPGASGHDPLGDRLRATFDAERTDIERRHTGIPPASRVGQLRWAPLAVAAAVIALAGFFFLGNRPADQAVELDVATQPGEGGGAEDAPTDGGEQDNGDGEVETYTGEGEPSGSATEPAATATSDPAPPNEEPPGPPPDEEPPTTPPVPDANRCGQDIAPGTPHFVTGIAVDDPDGGLVAHTRAGIEEPVTRILVLDEVVAATGGCTVLPSGSIWLQLAAPDGTADWASGRYLVPAKAACLVGEQVGTRLQADRNRTHQVREGDFLSAIAAQYGVEVDVLLAANPAIDSEFSIGDVLTIPPPSTTVSLIGPVEGVAWFDFSQVAFAQDGSDAYRWYPTDAVRITDSCFGTGPLGDVCLVGDILLTDPQSPEPVFRSSGSVEAQRTGRVIPAFGPGAIHDLVEVTVSLGGTEPATGLVDPTRTGFAESPCSTDPETLDTLEARPCAVNETTPLESSGSIGTSQSDADHIHNIRIQQSADCVRAVIELGTGAWTDSDRPAELLPEITSTKTATAATVRFAPCDSFIPDDCAIIGSGEGEPQQVNFPGGSVFIGVGGQHEVYVTMLHDFGQSSVTLINSPARIVIDWRPDASSTNALANPIIGQHAIFPGGLASFRPGETINGLARPFEAQGSFYVFEATGDQAAPLSEPVTAVFQDFYSAAGWSAGWGEFAVELPRLPDGDYVIAFGQAPPRDDGPVWVGSGALVSVRGSEVTPISVVDPINLEEPIIVNE